MWHERLLFKLECIGISGNLLSLLKCFLSNRVQQVVLIGQCFSWSPVLAGVLQGSVLGPLLFVMSGCQWMVYDHAPTCPHTPVFI